VKVAQYEVLGNEAKGFLNLKFDRYLSKPLSSDGLQEVQQTVPQKS
jgi:hypothetical protein